MNISELADTNKSPINIYLKIYDSFFVKSKIMPCVSPIPQFSNISSKLPRSMSMEVSESFSWLNFLQNMTGKELKILYNNFYKPTNSHPRLTKY